MKRAAPWLACALLLLGLNASAAENGVVAKIGDRVITNAEFERILALYTPAAKAQMARNPKFRQEVLEKYVEEIVLSQKARGAGLDALPEVKERVEIARNQVLAGAYLEKEAAGKAQLSEEELRRFYEANKAEFTKPEAARIRQILVRAGASATAADRTKAKAQAEELHTRLERGAAFEGLAAEYTDDPAMKKLGGSLGWVARGRLAPAIEKKVFALQPGQMTEVLETAHGYSIVKVEEKKDAAPEPFDGVRERVKELATRKATQQKIAEFRALALREPGVELYPDRKSEEALDPPHAHPPR